uniref:Uncharacterized protein LOC111118938 isoform X1 n=1 Tax=Crassostrea virginica TaxID=6565 RepID=A0A8B8CF02_CRAVI|nr:uncharacterized protein LOC111118938 isoform X1 [Crassostrea virginica]
MCSCCCRRSSKYKYIYIGTNGNAGFISTSVSSGLDPHRRDNFFSGNVWILVIKDYQISKKKTHMFKSERYVLLERRSYIPGDDHGYFLLAVLPLFSPYTHNSVPKQSVQ